MNNFHSARLDDDRTDMNRLTQDCWIRENYQKSLETADWRRAPRFIQDYDHTPLYTARLIGATGVFSMRQIR